MALTDAQKVVRNDTAKRMATALEGIETALGGLGSDNAKKADLTAISATGTTNATGATITAGTYFYLNGALVQAKADIAIGASFTNGTNYEAVTAGGLNSLNAQVASLNSQMATQYKVFTLNQNGPTPYNDCILIKTGNVVEFHGEYNETITANTNVFLGSVPSDCMPHSRRVGSVGMDNGGGVIAGYGACWIGTDGKITVSVSASAFVQIDAVWIVD